MTNQIKHNSPSKVLSQFNPVASLKPKTRKLVNDRFLVPIIENFFLNRGGIGNFCELDSDKLMTEIEFTRTQNFVKTYIYKEIIDKIDKNGNKIVFKPKYVITFDADLTNYKRDDSLYPYKAIFSDSTQRETNIKYGVIRLGDAPILYYIFIDLQKVIKFIKTLPEEVDIEETNKIAESEEEKRSRLFDTVIFEKQRQLRNAPQTQKTEIEQEISRLEQIRHSVLEGQSGKLRINLAWNTTDDLDLHILTPKGEISYKNKIVENNGVIGQLDVDKNAGNDVVSNPQENINFDAIPLGEHTIFVHFYSQRRETDVPFTLTIMPENGEGRIFTQIVKGKGSRKNVATFNYQNGDFNFMEVT